MKTLVTPLLILAAVAFSSQTHAQSINTSLVVNELSFSNQSISEGTKSALQYKKKKSKLLSIADFTLEPKTVFLCCTRSGYGFYFKF
ncbi:MAG: hypothetical protein ACPGU4_10250 [Flavobacteriales bacterium]